ncbi:helix-turn-helix domain-containing protein [Gluconacetobacter sp. Hr-1-5]|uniref:helix-turn-helix domain-containing protein n=1 Tax=Gluconacetobacter sp. Hr-1-5 TaxID=3395370 RepID=UPI003B52EE3B
MSENMNAKLPAASKTPHRKGRPRNAAPAATSAAEQIGNGINILAIPFLGAPAKAGTIAIGGKIKSRRKKLKMTLAQLAEASGLSAPFISQAENNKTVPSLVSLTALARALQIEVSYFVDVPKDENIVHRSDEPETIELNSPVVYHQLSSCLPDQLMDAILMTIPPGHRFPVDQRDGEDFLFVVEGEIISQVGDFCTTLRKGDSMHFRSISPHTAWNESNTPVILLYVGTPSIFRNIADQ